MLDKAIQLACKVHSGQKDLAGKPYILHPLRVMMKMETELEMVVAVLHDWMEDGEADDIVTEGLSDEVIIAVVELTHLKGETYEDYIKRVAKNNLSRKIKHADLDDNLDPERAALLDPVKNAKRREKYLWAKGYLLSSEGK